MIITPKITTTITHDESNDISNTEQNIVPAPCKDNETENFTQEQNTKKDDTTDSIRP